MSRLTPVGRVAATALLCPASDAQGAREDDARRAQDVCTSHVVWQGRRRRLRARPRRASPGHARGVALDPRLPFERLIGQTGEIVEVGYACRLTRRDGLKMT